MLLHTIARELQNLLQEFLEKKNLVKLGYPVQHVDTNQSSECKEVQPSEPHPLLKQLRTLESLHPDDLPVLLNHPVPREMLPGVILDERIDSVVREMNGLPPRLPSVRRFSDGKGLKGYELPNGPTSDGTDLNKEDLTADDEYNSDYHRYVRDHLDW